MPYRTDGRLAPSMRRPGVERSPGTKPWASLCTPPSDGRQIAHLHRSRRVRGRTVSELPELVVAPVPSQTRCRSSDAVVNTATDHRGSCEVTYLYGSCGICGRAVPQLTVTVESPRPHHSAGRQRQAVTAATSHTSDIRQVLYLYRCRALLGRPVAELAVLVVTPRPGGSISLRCEAMVLTS